MKKRELKQCLSMALRQVEELRIDVRCLQRVNKRCYRAMRKDLDNQYLKVHELQATVETKNDELAELRAEMSAKDRGIEDMFLAEGGIRA